MAEKPEDLSLPASVVARIIKDAVSSSIILCTIKFWAFSAASRWSERVQGGEGSHWKSRQRLHSLLHGLVRLLPTRNLHNLKFPPLSVIAVQTTWLSRPRERRWLRRTCCRRSQIWSLRSLFLISRPSWKVRLN